MPNVGKPLDYNLKNAFDTVFQKMLAQSKAYRDSEITAENVFQQAIKQNRPLLVEICSELLLRGSCVIGLEHLIELAELAKKEESCLICAKHTSNLDVPNFYTLMSRQGKQALDCFDRIVFVAGRKLNEDSTYMKMLAEMFSRVILCPKTYLNSIDLEEEEKRKLAKRINQVAQRTILQLRHQGYIFLLYPTGTRIRSEVPETSRALKETVAYLHRFDNLCFMNVLGNSLPPMLSNDLTSEIPHYDVVKFIVGPVQKTSEWLQTANAKFDQSGNPNSARKQWVADLVMQEINNLT